MVVNMKKGLLYKCCGAILVASMAAGMLTGCSGREESEPAEEYLAAGGQGTDAEQGQTAAGQGQAVDAAVLPEAFTDPANMFTDRDRSGEYDESECIRLELDSDTVTVTEEGTYILSGSLEGGMILVDADETAKIQLVLDNVDISNPKGAAIYVRQADKVFLTLAKGTVNTLSGGDSYGSVDENNIDGIIFAKSDLTINGEGSLRITAVTGHGVVSKDDLKVTGGSLTVSAPGHGLSGKDSVRVAGGTLDITAGKDGIHADNEEDVDKGYVYIEDGSFRIDAQDDGVHAEETAAVAGGDLDISVCCEGIEGKNVVVSGGSIRINSTDDGLNAAGDGGSILISGGTLYVNAGGDGIDSNGNIAVTGGEIYISGPETNANGVIDYETGAQITGGVLVAVGSSGMAMNFGEASTQGSALVSVSDSEAGTEIVLEDVVGNVLAAYTAESRFDSVVVSCPEMVQGGTYILRVGAEEYKIVLEGLICGEGFGGFGSMGGTPEWPGEGERSEMPEWPGEGERSEMPEGGTPEWPGEGERPEMPEGGTPEWPGEGERPEMPEGGMPGMPGSADR